MGPQSSSPAAGLGRLSESARVLWRGFGHRLELAALEIREARDGAMLSLALAGAALAFLFLAGLAFNLMIAAIFWDTPQRVPALVWLAIAEVAIAVAAAVWSWNRMRSWRPLEATREQMRKDAEWLQQMAARN